jgi:hypothetical protein
MAWGAAETSLAVATASVLAVAGGLKLAGREPVRHRLLGVLELAVAAGVLAGPTRPFGLGAASILALGFTGYALVRAEQPCRCFGERFRASTRRARFARALAVLSFAGFGLLTWLLSRDVGGADRWRLTAIVAGLLAGGLVVALPAALSKEGATAELRPSTL